MFATTSPKFGTFMLACFTVSGCVSAGAYDAKVEELEQSRQAAAMVDGEQRRKIAELERELAATRSEAVRLLADFGIAKDDIQASYDASTALVGELKAQLERSGQNVDKLLGEKATLHSSLSDAKRRLEEMRRQKTAIEARALAFKDLATRLRRMIDAGDLKVATRDGRMLLVLPTDVLFASGRTEIKADARAMLAQLGAELAAMPPRQFAVAGHTDNVPIHTARFPSNWELSSQRAIEVLKVLIAGGVPPDRLSAAGYGEFDPVASNETEEDRAHNRRIEITILPNIEELPEVPDVM